MRRPRAHEGLAPLARRLAHFAQRPQRGAEQEQFAAEVAPEGEPEGEPEASAGIAPHAVPAASGASRNATPNGAEAAMPSVQARR